MPIVPKEVTDQSDTQFQWLHFGGGNLYRAFHAEVTQTLIDQQALTKGIVVCETFDEQVIDQVYAPYENDILEVIMHEGGRLEKNCSSQRQLVIIAILPMLRVMSKYAKYFVSRHYSWLP